MSIEVTEVIGSIKRIDLEGGFYGIETLDGQQFFPLNVQYICEKHVGSNIRMEGYVKDVATIYMWGTPFYVMNILSITTNGITTQGGAYKVVDVHTTDEEIFTLSDKTVLLNNENKHLTTMEIKQIDEQIMLDKKALQKDIKMYYRYTSELKGLDDSEYWGSLKS